MLGRISMTMDGVYSSILLDVGLVLPAWHQEPAPCIWRNHFANAPLPSVDNEKAVK